MKYRELGRTKLKVSEIGFGSWAIGSSWGPVDRNESIAALRRAYEIGVNLYDTADVYGSEDIIGEALAGIPRDKYIIVSKTGTVCRNGIWTKDYSRQYILGAIDGSLKRLRTDCIDVHLFHGPPVPKKEIEKGECLDALLELKKQGKVKYIGLSIGDPEEGIWGIGTGKVDVLEVEFNILNQKAKTKLFPLAKEKNIGIIIRVPLASGILTGKLTKDTKFHANDHRSNWLKEKRLEESIAKAEKLKFLSEGKQKTLAQAAIQYVLMQESVSTVIPGAKTPRQAEENAGASDGKYLTAEEIKKIDTLVQTNFGL